MMKRVNSNIFTLPFPRVVYSSSEHEFYLQVAALILSFGEYESDGEDVFESFCKAFDNGEIVSYPIDEFGRIYGCFDNTPVGKPGDKVSPFHRLIMRYCQTDTPDEIPLRFIHAKEALDGFGIEVLDEGAYSLEMEIYGFKNKDRYRFDTISDVHFKLPFYHDYEMTDYSEETLCRDIAETLRSLFSVLPEPKRLFLSVKDPETKKPNRKIVTMLKKLGPWDFEIMNLK